MRTLQTILLMVATAALTGCIPSFTKGSTLPTARELADCFETSQVGTPLSQVRKLAPLFFLGQPEVIAARQAVDVWLVCNASGVPSCRLYRLYPPDVLLTTARDDDQVARFPVRETFAYDCPDGAVEVLLSADGRFKGYYAYSSRGYSRDSKERLQAEREYFRRVLKPLVPEASARLASRGGGGDAWNRSLPHLPLKLPVPAP